MKTALLSTVSTFEWPVYPEIPETVVKPTIYVKCDGILSVYQSDYAPAYKATNGDKSAQMQLTKYVFM